MSEPARFRRGIVSSIHESKYLRIRAGDGDHRFISIWAVVVEGRVFVRSWYLKPRSWYRTFLVEPRGAIEVDGRVIPVRAINTRSERLKSAVDQAYLEKYTSPANLKYARGFSQPRLRATTTELVPLG